MTEPMEQSKSFEIDKEQFGAFIAQLRKEKGLTQKALGSHDAHRTDWNYHGDAFIANCISYH